MSSITAVPYKFSDRVVNCFFNADFGAIEGVVQRDKTVFITDENVFAAHKQKFAGWKAITIQPGESFKNQDTVNDIIAQLIAFNADRESFIVGIGGGVVTDITGFVASIYMRGVKFGFAPTSVLAMVDASVGGKNGIDVGLYKNIVGIINQPQFLFYDYSFLETLPDSEWVNGFAEIIKHACIKDEEMFHSLEKNSIEKFQSSDEMIGELIKRNVGIKFNVVLNDEHEKGDRKLLNFGHTIGHAIENANKLSHGNAISIGMVAACRISEKIAGFDSNESRNISELLSKYELPISFDIDKEKTWQILQHDKKKAADTMNFVVLNKIGKAAVQPISMENLYEIFKEIL